MNFFDKESKIIENLQLTQSRESYYVNKTKEAKRIFKSLHRGKQFLHWIDSSGKDEMPPDFYSDKYMCMLEVMRVDDYVVCSNSPNALESRFYKKYNSERRKNELPTFEEAGIDLLVIPDMSKASENNYETYIENFRQTVGSHVNKIKKYRANHPGYKLGFLIFDEAPGYVVFKNRPEVIPHGVPVMVDGLHWHFRDKNLLEVFVNSDLDFVIWMTPYKNLPMNPRRIPTICIFDLSEKGKRRIKMVNYVADEMQCLECK